MTEKEGMFHEPQKNLEEEKVRKAYELYVGVCDVYSPEEARAMADEVRKERQDPNRKVMIGVMTHPLALNPDIEDPVGVREVFPTREQLADGFTDDPDVLNTVHYADLYGPRKGQNLLENLEKSVEYGGEHLHAIQLDVTWPDPNELKKFRDKHQETIIVLQVGKFALSEVDGDPQKVVDRLKKYGDSIDHVLLDMSMGKGQGMEAGGLLPLLRLIRQELPELGLAVAGGLGPESVDLLEPIAQEFPDISIDAQGNVKTKDAPKDEKGHLLSTHPADLSRSKEYLKKACRILDSFKKKITDALDNL